MAERALSFDIAAEAYEQGRPGWPDTMLDLVPVAADATVLDLGAGTGKLTRTLVRRYARVLAVEPLPGMRAVLERELPQVEAHEGAADAMPLADGFVDAVFCGQSAHWFATEEAIAEIARVLRPGGVLAAAWNEPDGDRPSPLPAACRDRLADLRPALPAEEAWARAVATGPFGAQEEASVAHEHASDRDAVLRGASSMSWIASRDDREAVLAELAGLLPEGDYRFPLRTWVTWAVRR